MRGPSRNPGASGATLSIHQESHGEADGGRHWLRFSRGDPMMTVSHAPPDSDDPWLRATLALMDEAVIGTTIDGTVVTWNDGARRLLGYHARETIGCPRWMLTFPDAWADTHALYEEAGVGAPIVSRDVAWLHRDGSILRLPVSRFAVHDALGHPYGILEVVQDDGLSHGARLIALRQTIARLAHEMSEPMSAIAAYLHAGNRLLDRGLPSDLVEAGAVTERALAELARAVDVLRRLRVSALRDATLQDVAVRPQHRTDPEHKPDEYP
jgi:PAS domain S-box-containing protein